MIMSLKQRKIKFKPRIKLKHNIYPKLKLCYWEEHGNRENKNKLAERKAFDDSMTNVATLASFIRNL